MYSDDPNVATVGHEQVMGDGVTFVRYVEKVRHPLQHNSG